MVSEAKYTPDGSGVAVDATVEYQKDDEKVTFTFPSPLQVGRSQPPDKSGYWKTIFFLTHPKHMLWVLKRTVSMRRFF